MRGTLALAAYLQEGMGSHPQEKDYWGRSQRASSSLPVPSLSIVKVRCPKKAAH